MRNKMNVLKIRQFGIIAIVALISFVIITLSFTGCCNGTTKSNTSGGNGGSGNSGGKEPKDTHELEISDQVWAQAGGATYEEFDEDLEIIGPSYAKGSVVNGILSFTLGVPTDFQNLGEALTDSLVNVANLLSYSEDSPAYDITTGANAVVFERLILPCEDEWDWYEIRKRRTGETTGALMYVYVKKDVTVTGKGKSAPVIADSSKYKMTLNDFSLSLKAGWNPVKMIQEYEYLDNDDFVCELVETVSLGDHDDFLWALWFKK